MTPLIASIVSNEDHSTDRLILDFISGLRCRGFNVQGLIQHPVARTGRCHYVLTDLQTGDEYPISQDLGPHARGCTLDTGALAEASRVLRKVAALGDADLVIVNRFGKVEANGSGFASEMLELMCREIPLLTAVKDINRPAWQTFTGGLARELPPTLAALNNWFDALMPNTPRK